MRWSGSLCVSNVRALPTRSAPSSLISGPVRSKGQVYSDDWAARARRARLCYRHLFMVKEGYYFGLPPLFFGGITLALQWWVTAGILIAFALFCFSFFRDPHPAIPPAPYAVVSPADRPAVVLHPQENTARPG